MIRARVVFGIALFCSTWIVQAFDLFDADRGTDKTARSAASAAANAAAAAAANANNVAPPPPPPAPSPPAKPQQDFTLRGTSRIGDKRVAMLQAPDGKEFMQRLRKNERTPLDGYPTYFLVKIDGREATLEYPSDAPCRVSSPVKGLQCKENGKVAVLNLMRKGAIAPPPPPQPPPVAAQPVLPAANPAEERKRQEEELKKRQELYKNFQKQVIKDEDVPPGMRVVRTPFGDRLIPAN